MSQQVWQDKDLSLLNLVCLITSISLKESIVLLVKVKGQSRL
jgi:hypothetical protein